MTSLSFVKSVGLIAGVNLEAPIRLRHDILEIRVGISQFVGMQRGPPYTYVDDDGNRYLNARQVSQIVSGVGEATMYRWFEMGRSSFGFKLDIKIEPLIHSPNGYRHNALTHRKHRKLIPESQAFALRDVLEAVGRKRPGPWSPGEMDALEATAIRYQRRLARQMPIKHSPRPRAHSNPRP